MHFVSPSVSANVCKGHERQDVELSVLEAVMGYDSHLDAAIQLIVDEYGDEEQIEDDDYNEEED